MKTVQECEKFLAQVGMATVLPGKKALLPCMLWEAQGHRGPFQGADEPFLRVWSWKDELPARRMAFAGRLLGDQVLLVHTRLLPALLGGRGPLDVTQLYEDGELSREAWELWKALVASKKPLGRKALRRTLGLEDKSGAGRFDRACRDLERLVLVTRAGSSPQASGWDSNAYVLVQRHFPDTAALRRRESVEALDVALREAAPEASPAQLGRWLAALT